MGEGRKVRVYDSRREILAEGPRVLGERRLRVSMGTVCLYAPSSAKFRRGKRRVYVPFQRIRLPPFSHSISFCHCSFSAPCWEVLSFSPPAEEGSSGSLPASRTPIPFVALRSISFCSFFFFSLLFPTFPYLLHVIDANDSMIGNVNSRHSGGDRSVLGTRESGQYSGSHTRKRRRCVRFPSWKWNIVS